VARLDGLNARIGARRSRLLGPAGLRDLLARPTLEGRLELLARTSWGGALPAGVARGDDPLGAVEAALRGAVHAEALRMVERAEGARPRALLTAFLELDAPQALKVVLRGVVAGAPPDRIAAMAPPAPSLPPVRVRELAAAPRVEAVAEALSAQGHPLAPALAAALAARAEHGLLPLEVALDRAAGVAARAACALGGEDGRILAGHLADLADARNAATLLALAGAPPSADLFVEGGTRLPAAAFGRLAGAEAPALRAALAAVFPGGAAALARPWSAERALERALAARLHRAARARPLSIAVPLAYLAARRAEARRIAVVLRGAALGLPGDEILDLAEA
jgi:V/A-type H+-transporting ATPase subunit C